MTETLDQLTAKLKQLHTKRHLQAAPDMVAHILTLVTPNMGGRSTDKVSGSRETPLPLNAQALEDANGLYAQLVNWSISHARALKVLPPSIALGWSRRDLNCDGFPSWAKTTDAGALTSDITNWLLVGANRIANLPVAHAYYDDVNEIVKPLYGRYPTTPRTETFAARHCPVCEKRTVIVNFDDWSDDVSVACTYCGHARPESWYESYLKDAP